MNEEHGEEVDDKHGEEMNEEHGEEVDEEHGEVVKSMGRRWMKSMGRRWMKMKNMGRREPFNLLRTCVPYSPLQQPTEHSSGTHQPVLPCTTAQDSAGWG